MTTLYVDSTRTKRGCGNVLVDVPDWPTSGARGTATRILDLMQEAGHLEGGPRTIDHCAWVELDYNGNQSELVLTWLWRDDEGALHCAVAYAEGG